MSWRVPGTVRDLVEERDETGRLRSMALAGRTYVRVDDDGTRRFDGGVAMSELAIGRTLFRRVTAPAGSWTEIYRVDEDGRPVHVDGVDVSRDPQHRVIACGEWRYAYAGDDLAAIEWPGGVRHLTRDAAGRLVRARDDAGAATLTYDADGRRVDVPPPPESWHRDELGRLWTVTGPDGSIAMTFLWDGFACLGRIDGPPGAPLAAVFSLDPTCTPVRVIQDDEVVRIPRDAFGEALLAHPGVPGLFGGAPHGGYVHYAARPLDPVTGAWTGPDPWSGRADDPRRADGFRGTLLVEKGPYTVCLGDPVGRVDHTGEASAALILSTVTWSWQNNLVGWLAMDFLLNFWVSVFGAIGDSTIWDRFTSSTAVSASDHIGAFGVRRDGILWSKNGGFRAWTYQHMVWAHEEHFDELLDAQVFTPGAPFEPRLYGSVLHLRPTDKPSVVLVGDNSSGGTRPGRPSANWTRGMSRDADGRSRARPLWEGSLAASFPSGPLHLNSPVSKTRGNLGAQVAELVPSGAFALGTIEPRAVLAIERTGLVLDPGATVYFGNGEGVISRVLSVEEEGGRTLVRIEDDATAVDATSARIRAVARQTEEDVPRGAAADQLNIVASSTAGAPTPNDYDIGDFLRFSTGATQLGARRVVRFEARISIDAALPPAITAPLTVRPMTITPGGNGALTADPLQIRITAGPPANGSAIAVTRGATVIPVFVEVDPVDAQLFKTDRELYTGPSLDGTGVTWERLSGGTDLTTAAPLPAGLDLTYEPTETRRAPAAGFVTIESTGGRTMRAVTARAYDALVLNSAVPGTADPVHVERFTGVAGGADEAVAAVTVGGALSVQAGQQLFAAGADPRRLVVQLVGLGSPPLAAGTALTLPVAPPPPPPLPPPVFAGSTMTLVYPGLGGRDANIAPSSPVILSATAGGALEVNVVRELWLTLPLDRALPAVGGNLRVATLDAGSFAYDGVRVAGTTVTVLPNVTGTGRVQMPQFWPGEIVQVAYTVAAAARTRLFRVVTVDGATLELAEDQPIEAAAAAITVARMKPTDPSTGGPWRALDGAVVPGPANQIRVKAWRANEFASPVAVAVVDGAAAHPAAVMAGPVTLEIAFVAPPAAPAYTVSMPTPRFSAFVTEIRREDDAYLISSALPPAATANPDNLVAAITYAESTPAVDGAFGPGTVLVPDIETFEVDRRQSLVDHELTHTNQSARWGPMMLCFLPIQLLMVDKLVDLIPGVDAPEFSAYLPGTLGRAGPRYELTVANASGVTFAAGNQVEVTLGHVVLRVELGAKTDDAFAVIANDATELAAGLADNTSEAVQVRLQRSPGFWGHAGRNLQSLLHLSTHGGVLNLTVGSTYGALLGLLARLVYAAGRSIFTSTQDFPAQVVENGAALRLTSDAGKAAFRTEPRVAIAGSNTQVRAIGAREEEGALIRLVGVVPATPADVRVSVYSTRNDDSSFDWHSYFPASVPDETRPAQVRVDKVGESLSLAVGDEVWLRDGPTTWHSKVVGANDEGTAILVDLAKPVARSTATHAFRLAKVDAGSPGFDPDSPSTLFRDPLGFLSDDLMNLTGAGWMRWVINPWGESLGRLHHAVPDNSFWWKFLRVFTHVASTSLSTYGWSLMPPAFGWLMWDRELTGKEHQSYLEQEASSASGDLYSPAGRMFGLRSDGMVVGDVARYVYYQLSRKSSTIVGGQQDKVAVSVSTSPRVGIDPAVANPGRAVPDLLYQRRLSVPYAIGDAVDNTFAADVGGILPTSDQLERAAAVHVAFTRPSGGGTHSATLAQNTPARLEAQESTDYQPAFFNLSVGDVSATVAGQTVTNDGSVRLVEGQRARVSVSPNTARRYRAALLRAGAGTLLRLDDLDRIVAQASTGTEAAQINRVYEPEELQTHLRRRFVVPVREFDITVVDAPPLVSALPATADGVFAGLAQNPKPGDSVFVVVPCAIDVALAVDAATLGGLTAPTITVDATPAGLSSFVGDGSIYRVAFAAGDAPAAPVAVTFRVTVRGDAPIVLSVVVTVDPP